MRGRREPQVSMLAFVDLEARVPPGHPLRAVKAIADGSLAALYAKTNPRQLREAIYQAVERLWQHPKAPQTPNRKEEAAPALR